MATNNSSIYGYYGGVLPELHYVPPAVPDFIPQPPTLPPLSAQPPDNGGGTL